MLADDRPIFDDPCQRRSCCALGKIGRASILWAIDCRASLAKFDACVPTAAAVNAGALDVPVDELPAGEPEGSPATSASVANGVERACQRLLSR